VAWPLPVCATWHRWCVASLQARRCCCCVLFPALAGPADMGFSFGLHVQHDYDLPAMMASSEMQQIHEAVLQVGW
jgi:hypothetical protein